MTSFEEVIALLPKSLASCKEARESLADMRDWDEGAVHSGEILDTLDDLMIIINILHEAKANYSAAVCLGVIDLDCWGGE